MACEQLFLKELKKKGYRFTPQREIVLEIMHHLDKPATAEEIFTQVQEITKTVDKSTVYRTLDLFQQFGLVSVVNVQGINFYEHIGLEQPHVHLLCSQCGKIFNVPLAEAQPLMAGFAAQYHFTVDPTELTFQGICETCQEKSKTDH